MPIHTQTLIVLANMFLVGYIYLFLEIAQILLGPRVCGGEGGGLVQVHRQQSWLSGQFPNILF